MRSKFLIAMLSSAVLTGPAFAQEAQSQGGNDSSNDIIVTAQRSSQRLQDVPLSVQAVDYR